MAEEGARSGPEYIGPIDYQYANGVAVAKLGSMVFVDFFQVGPHDENQHGVARIVVTAEVASILRESLSDVLSATDE